MGQGTRTWTGDLHREYGRQRLRRADLSPDPIAQFRSWFEEGKPTVLEPSAMAIATANGKGEPSVRMVLMKAFDAHGIVFATSYGSRKAHELSENPHAALLFYWPVLERQIRVTGQISKTSERDSDEIFRARSRMSRIAARISHQSQPVSNRDELEQLFKEESERLQGLEASRPYGWGGYQLRPDSFEFWQGGENRLHDRFLYTKSSSGWTIQRLQP